MRENFAEANQTDRKRKRGVGQRDAPSVNYGKKVSAWRDCCIKMRLVGANFPEEWR